MLLQLKWDPSWWHEDIGVITYCSFILNSVKSITLLNNCESGNPICESISTLVKVSKLIAGADDNYLVRFSIRLWQCVHKNPLHQCQVVLKPGQFIISASWLSPTAHYALGQFLHIGHMWNIFWRMHTSYSCHLLSYVQRSAAALRHGRNQSNWANRWYYQCCQIKIQYNQCSHWSFAELQDPNQQNQFTNRYWSMTMFTSPKTKWL